MYGQTGKQLGTIGIAGGKAALNWWQEQTPEDKARYQEQSLKIATKTGHVGLKIATKTGHAGLKIATKTEQLGLRGMTKMYGRIQEKVQERQEKTAGPDDGTSKQDTTDTLVEEKYAENSRRETANGNWPVQHT